MLMSGTKSLPTFTPLVVGSGPGLATGAFDRGATGPICASGQVALSDERLTVTTMGTPHKACRTRRERLGLAARRVWQGARDRRGRRGPGRRPSRRRPRGDAARRWPLGVRASKPMRLWRPNSSSSNTSWARSTGRSRTRSPSTCARVRRIMAAGRCTPVVTSTSAPRSRPTMRSS